MKTCTYLLHEVGQNQIRVEDRDELGSKVVAQTRDAGALDQHGSRRKSGDENEWPDTKDIYVILNKIQ